MSFIHALGASRQRFLPLALIALAIAAILAFALGAEASAKSSGGLGVGGTKASAATGEHARLYDSLPAGEKRWARATSRCESGGDPNAIGGGGAYRGAFQFLKSTWRTSPKSPGGDPIDYDYRTQAVVAVLLKKRDGAGHWPVCG